MVRNIRTPLTAPKPARSQRPCGAGGCAQGIPAIRIRSARTRAARYIGLHLYDAANMMPRFPIGPQGFVRPECRSVFRLLSCLHVSPAVLPHGIRTRVSAAAQSSSGHGHGRPVSRNVGRMPPTLRRYLPSSFESRSTTSGCSSATSCFSEMSFGMSNSSLRPVS